MNRFWLLWNPSHPSPPRVRFDNRAEALRVAEEMAKKNPGEEFYVLCATSLVQAEANPVKVTPLLIPNWMGGYKDPNY